ncbi:hypothetical protein Q1695_015527 [Nippostrongylus brasiliensis]|nr:hypothetical protein Q1695_015527 [Nippostrongylus brasiliensis]
MDVLQHLRQQTKRKKNSTNYLRGLLTTKRATTKLYLVTSTPPSVRCKRDLCDQKAVMSALMDKDGVTQLIEERLKRLFKICFVSPSLSQNARCLRLKKHLPFWSQKSLMPSER